MVLEMSLIQVFSIVWKVLASLFAISFGVSILFIIFVVILKLIFSDKKNRGKAIDFDKLRG